MKKILFAIVIVMMLGMTVNAQRDGFFSNYDNYNREGGSDPVPGIVFPEHNDTNDANDTPLGTGLLVLTALGAGYAVARKKR
ncbi:MAG: hypothetical protein K6A73_05080 [Bacteroidales bacterium]|nr:hypothetical protein [Bacteroidales bacterium]